MLRLLAESSRESSREHSRMRSPDVGKGRPGSRTRRTSVQLLCAVLAALLGCSAPEEFWTCYVATGSPILSIATVRDSSTGAYLAEVRISSIVANGSAFGHDIDMLFLKNGPGAHGVTIDGNELICWTECSFGFTSGTWRLTFVHEGYLPKAMSLVAEYTSKETTNRCQVHQGGAVRIDVLLTQLDP